MEQMKPFFALDEERLRDEVILFPYYQHSSRTIFSLFIFRSGRCVIALNNRNMRTVTNIFILNLAISDLLVGIFCIPTTLVDNFITGQNLIKGDMMKICLHCDILWFVYFRLALQCKLSGLIQRTSVCASVFTLVAIAVDRHAWKEDTGCVRNPVALTSHTMKGPETKWQHLQTCQHKQVDNVVLPSALDHKINKDETVFPPAPHRPVRPKEKNRTARTHRTCAGV
nr:neuropeptide FF receptor 1 like 3 [Misgurnus anguillicaudatus]